VDKDGGQDQALKSLRHLDEFLRSARQAGRDRTTLIINHFYPGGSDIYARKVVREHLDHGEMALLLTNARSSPQLKLTGFYRDIEAVFPLSKLDDLEPLFEDLPVGYIFYNNILTYREPLQLVRLVSRLQSRFGCSVSIALHDYYPLCPSFNLLTNRGQFCNLPEISVCRDCLPSNFHVHVRTEDSYDIDTWRSVWQEAFREANRVLCFSESSRPLLMKVYPFLRPEQIEVRPHELPAHFACRVRYDLRRPLHIGVVGDLGYHKGSQMVIDVAQILAQKAPEARITVIGMLDREAAFPNLEVTGPYEIADLPGQLERHGINLCLFPSVWPETFSFVCSELMELGMPLVCYDLGAQGARVRQYALGHVITEISPEETVEEIIRFFSRIKENRKE
jgi:O-antigen biosynthesis protein